jgi:hypothetical protein
MHIGIDPHVAGSSLARKHPQFTVPLSEILKEFSFDQFDQFDRFD